eukprot:s241_g7.t1
MFAQLIRPLTVDAFFRDVWERAPRVFQAAAEYHLAPLSWEVLDEVLLRALAPGCPEETELVIYKGLKPSEEYSSPTAAYLDGASIIVNHVDKVWRPVFELCRALHEFPSLYANCYVTPQQSQAAPPHADDRDVIVFQLEGTKHWKIYGEAPIYMPYPSEQVGKNGLEVPPELLDSKPDFEQTLKVGDVLYVPRGFVHEATTQNEASLHLTVAVPSYDWTVSRVLCDALQTRLDGPGGREENPWRRAVPFRTGRWTEMPGVFDKARLREIVEQIDLNHAQAVFRAKNAHHNERQEDALSSAESCPTARPPVTSSSELRWRSGAGSVDGFEDVDFIHPDGAQCNLDRVPELLPKNSPLRPSDIASYAFPKKRRRTEDPKDRKCHGHPRVALGCPFSRICFAAVCVESGLAAFVDSSEKMLGVKRSKLGAFCQEMLAPDLTGRALIEAAGEYATQAEFEAAELRLLRAVEYRMHRPTPFHHRDWFVEYVHNYEGFGERKAANVSEVDLETLRNELGALLGHWTWRCWRKRNPSGDASKVCMVASAVSSKFLKTLAEKEGFRFVETLTGFKWMGSKSAELRAEGFEVIFSYEEAIGFCDGICAAAVFVDMAKDLRQAGRSCQQHLQQLYIDYGIFLSMNSYVKSPDPALTKRIFAAQRPEGKYFQKVADFAISDVRDLTDGKPELPLNIGRDQIWWLLSNAAGNGSNVKSGGEMITYYFGTAQAEVTLRTSGTEPKIKWYSEMRTADAAAAAGGRAELQRLVRAVVLELLDPIGNKLEIRSEDAAMLRLAISPQRAAARRGDDSTGGEDGVHESEDFVPELLSPKQGSSRRSRSLFSWRRRRSTEEKEEAKDPGTPRRRSKTPGVMTTLREEQGEAADERRTSGATNPGQDSAEAEAATESGTTRTFLPSWRGTLRSRENSAEGQNGTEGQPRTREGRPKEKDGLVTAFLKRATSRDNSSRHGRGQRAVPVPHAGDSPATDTLAGASPLSVEGNEGFSPGATTEEPSSGKASATLPFSIFRWSGKREVSASCSAPSTSRASPENSATPDFRVEEGELPQEPDSPRSEREAVGEHTEEGEEKEIDEDKLPDDQKAALRWEKYRAQNRSIVGDVFEGQLRSQLRCNCSEGHTSSTFEPFRYLSIPIPSNHMDRFELKVVFFPAMSSPHDRPPPQRLSVLVPKSSTAKRVQLALARQLSIGRSALLLAEVYRSRIHRYLDPNLPLSDVRSEDQIVAFEVPQSPQDLREYEQRLLPPSSGRESPEDPSAGRLPLCAKHCLCRSLLRMLRGVRFFLLLTVATALRPGHEEPTEQVGPRVCCARSLDGDTDGHCFFDAKTMNGNSCEENNSPKNQAQSNITTTGGLCDHSEIRRGRLREGGGCMPSLTNSRILFGQLELQQNRRIPKRVLLATARVRKSVLQGLLRFRSFGGVSFNGYSVD